jgi:cytochrome c peroxidase
LKKVFFIVLLIVSWAFRVSTDGGPGYHEPDIPAGFPEVAYPAGNEPTQARWELGKKLFFDPIMSRDLSISCSSCHAPHLAFSDSVPLSPGVDSAAGKRNAPSLTNVAYHPYFTRDGGVPTLEMHILVPIQEHNEFDTNILIIAERMAQDSSYTKMSRAAYDRVPDSFVITRALANYQRSFISGNSPYDQYAFQGKKSALNDLEKEGMDLFFSERARCTSCHGGFNFTDYGFENNGLYVQYADSGRIRFSELETDRDRFKVPSLRNLSYSAPYMHDGSIADLESVIEHYSEGIQPTKNLSNELEPLHFSAREKQQLLAFLMSLNDPSFVEKFSSHTY